MTSRSSPTKKVEILQQKGHSFLWIDGSLWMWDITEEEEDQKEIAKSAFGDVLVAGYGLGILQKYLLKNKRVNSVLTIEKLKEVIDACKRTYGKIYGEVEICDFFKYKPPKKFNCVIGDIWPDQALKHLNTYIKFKNKAKTLLKEGGRILGWGMDYFEYLLKIKRSSPTEIMKNLEPKIFRQRLIIEGHYTIEADGETLRKYLNELSKVLKMRIFAGPFSWPPDKWTYTYPKVKLKEGLSGFVAWTESGCQAYTWKSCKFFTTDIYSCKKFDAAKVFEFTRDFFKSEDLVYQEI